MKRITDSQVIKHTDGGSHEQLYCFGHLWGPAYFKEGSRDYEEYLSIVQKLKAYEDTGLTPEEIMDGRMLTGWIPVEERQPRKNEPVLVFAQSTTIRSGEIMLVGACDNGYWSIQSGKDTLGYPCNDFRVIAWMPLPEPYRPEA